MHRAPSGRSPHCRWAWAAYGCRDEKWVGPRGLIAVLAAISRPKGAQVIQRNNLRLMVFYDIDSNRSNRRSYADSAAVRVENVCADLHLPHSRSTARGRAGGLMAGGTSERLTRNERLCVDVRVASSIKSGLSARWRRVVRQKQRGSFRQHPSGTASAQCPRLSLPAASARRILNRDPVRQKKPRPFLPGSRQSP